MPEIVLIPEVGDIVAGKYRIEKLLGRGGMGSVYAVQHTSTQRVFALKLLSAAFSEDNEARVRFVREAKLAGIIDHPAVVRMYDIGNYGASLYIIMDLLVGESLNDRLKRGPIPLAEAIRIMRGIIDGVSAAHKKGIVHRDLKPENIFLCRTSVRGFSEPRILDFGVSKALGGGDASVLALTKTGEILGTPLYMSPEQVQGTKDVDQRADIYALGVILYQMVSGEIPFKADTFPKLVFEIISGAIKPLSQTAPDLPEELNDVIMTAMAHSPNDRFADVDRLAQAIGPFGDRNSKPIIDSRDKTRLRRFSIRDTATPFNTEVETMSRNRSPFRKRLRVALVAYLVVALVIIAVTFYAFGPRLGTSSSAIMQAAEPPQSSKVIPIVSQPITSKAVKRTPQIQGKTKVAETRSSPPTEATAPKEKNAYSSRRNEKKRSRPIAETSKKTIREVKPEKRRSRKTISIEKKPEPPEEWSDFEIGDERIIDPFKD